MEKMKLNIQFFAVDAGVEFNFDIGEMEKQLKVLKNEVMQNQQVWNGFAAANENWEQSANGVEERLSNLTTLIEKQEAIIKNLTEQHTKWAEKLDEGNPKLSRLAANIEKAKAELAKSNAEFENHKKKLIQVGDEYKTLEEIMSDFNRDIDIANASFAKATVGIDDWTRSTIGLEAKLKQLSAVSAAQESKVQILEKEYSKLVKAKKEYTQEGKKLLTQLTKEQTSLAKTQNELEEYSTDTYKARTRVKELKDIVKKLTDEFETLERQQGSNINDLAELKIKISQATNEYKDLERQLGDVEKESDDVNAANKRLKEGFTVVKGVVTNLLTDGIRRISAGLGDMARNAAKAARDFETSFTNIVKTVDATEEELKILKKDLMELSTEVSSPIDEINNVASAAGQLGIEAKNIAGFTKAMIMMGDSTNLSAGSAAEQLARLTGITGMSQDKFENLGSALVALGNKFPTTEGEIVSMSMRIAGAGKQVGLTEAEILALATSFSSVGVEAEMGGTAISKALSKMQVAVTNGTGKIDKILKDSGMSFRDLELMYENNTTQFKKFAQSIGMTSSELSNLLNAKGDLNNFAEIAGVTAEQFTEKWGKDAVGAFHLFIKGLSDTSDAGENALTMLTDMGITEVRLRDSLVRAANSTDTLTKAMKISNEAFAEGTALATEAERRYETLDSKMVMMQNTAKLLGISIYEKFAEPAKEAVDAFKDTFSNLKTELEGKEVSEALEIIAKAVGDLVKSFAQLLGKWIPKMIKGLASLVKNWKTVEKVLGTVITALVAYTVASKAVVMWTKLQTTGAVALKLAMGLLRGNTIKATTAQLGLNAAQMANPMGIVIGLVAALAAGLVYLAAKTIKAKKTDTEYTKQLKEEKKAIEELSVANKKNKESIIDRNKAQEESISKGLSEIGHLQNLWKELQTITDENGKIKSGYEARVKFIIGELNSALGTEIKLNDGIIQGYKKIQEEIDKTIKKKKAMIILDAKEEDYKTALETEGEVRETYTNAENTKNNLQNKYNSKENEVKNLEKQLEDLKKQELALGTGREGAEQRSQVRREISNIERKLRTAKTELRKTKEALNDAEKEFNNAATNYQEIIQDIVDYESISSDILAGNYDKILSDYLNLRTDYTKATGEDLKKSTSSWLAYLTGYQKSLEDAIADGDETAQKIAEQGMTTANTELTKIAQSLAGQVSTIEEMSPEVQEAWKLLAQNAKGIYLQVMSTLSPEQQAILANLTGVTATGGTNLATEWANIASNSLSALTGQQILFQDAGNGLVQMVINGVEVGEPLATDKMETLTSDIIKKIEEGEVGATEAGKMLAEGVGEGIEDKETNDSLWVKIGSWGKTVLAKIKASLKEHSPSKATREDGANLLKGLGLGIDDEEGKVLKQIDDFGKTALSTLQDRLGKMRSTLNGNLGLNSDSLNEIGQIQGKTGKTVIINQTNNSPKALNQLEIYRRTKNAAQLAARS